MAHAYLKKRQNSDGSWSNPQFPALTGLAVYAFLTFPGYADLNPPPDFITRALDYIISNAHENGSIYKDSLPAYSTSICVLALLAANDAGYRSYILKARNYLAARQLDQGKKGVPDQPFDGGIGYGTMDHADLSCSCVALEAIKSSRFPESGDQNAPYKHLEKVEKNALDWDAAIKFITRCQNLSGRNDQAWPSDDEKNRGGFIDYPGFSKAGEKRLPDGKNAWRSYGSMTCAGLLSYIIADLEKDDPRIRAAYGWLQRNYTLDENPGLGQQELYYYYYTMAKALTLYGCGDLVLENGRKINWRQEMAVTFINNQKEDGCWVNESGINEAQGNEAAGWRENDPVLVTCYVLISLNMITTFM